MKLIMSRCVRDLDSRLHWQTKTAKLKLQVEDIMINYRSNDRTVAATTRIHMDRMPSHLFRSICTQITNGNKSELITKRKRVRERLGESV